MKKVTYLLFTVLMFIFSGCAEMTTPPIHEAAYTGDVKSLESLVDAGGNVDEWYYGTPLIWAAGAGQMQSVKFLVEHGANIDAKADMGWTPLGNALSEGKDDVAQYLFDKGASFDNTMVGLNHWNEFCVTNQVDSCVVKLKSAMNRLKLMQSKKQLQLQVQQKQEAQDALKTAVDKYLADKDLNGLKEYTDKNPNAVYYITDEWIRLAMTGPKGLKIGDIREYLKNGKSELILLSMIKQQEVPYKKFSLEEIDMLISMGLPEKVIAALIDETTNLMRDEKLRKQQEFYLAEQKKVAGNQPTVIYQNTANQNGQQNQVIDKVQDEVIKQGVGLLLDQLFR
ncbi:ankyrin repeat domain-containing protein [bacterium]|nr:ankyrin repeat domain-containing protein [bacterium]MBU1882687.1 ankyrin repeat domain-containing protein [bacterium]